MEKIGIIIPAHNEEKRILKTMKSYYDFFKSKKEIKDFKILIVINNTKDKTEKIVRDFIKKRKEVGFIIFERGGKGFAVTQGIKYFIKEDFNLIGFTDADLATTPEQFYNLLKNINKNDGIISSRYIKDSLIDKKQSIKRRVVSRVGNFIIRAFFNLKYRDTQCGSKIFKKGALLEVIDYLAISQWAFDVELLYYLKRKKFKIREFPIRWRDIDNSTLDLERASIQFILALIQLRLKNSLFRRLLEPVNLPISKIWRKLI